MSAEKREPLLRAGKKHDLPPYQAKDGLMVLTEIEKHIVALWTVQYNKISSDPRAGEAAIRIIKRYESSIRPEVFRTWTYKTLESLVSAHRMDEAVRAAKVAGKGYGLLLDEVISKKAIQLVTLEKEDEEKRKRRDVEVQRSLNASNERYYEHKNFWRRFVGLPPLPVPKV